LLVSLLDPEDAGSMFLRNMVKFLPDYTASYSIFIAVAVRTSQLTEHNVTAADEDAGWCSGKSLVLYSGDAGFEPQSGCRIVPPLDTIPVPIPYISSHCNIPRPEVKSTKQALHTRDTVKLNLTSPGLCNDCPSVRMILRRMLN
jgi:hypothetical protein